MIKQHFIDAQKEMNFVVLYPERLPKTVEITHFTIREETDTVRPSLRFEVIGSNFHFRIKQFFYDWGIPVIYAATNLVKKERSFISRGIGGFIGSDYKGNRAACSSRWFTQIELSLLDGELSDQQIIEFFDNLEPLSNKAVHDKGLEGFTKISHSARYNYPKWGSHDEITRVQWHTGEQYENIKARVQENIKSSTEDMGFLILPYVFKHFYIDSIGYKEHKAGLELHYLLRSNRNHTDGIWLWIAPATLSDPLPEITTEEHGLDNDWQVTRLKRKRLGLSHDVDLYISELHGSLMALQLHWKNGSYVYHLYVRPQVGLGKEDILELFDKLVIV